MSWLTQSLGIDKANNAQKTLSDQQKQVSSQAGNLATGEAANLAALQSFQKMALPSLGTGLQNAEANTTQAGRNSLVSNFGAQQRGQAGDIGAQAATTANLSPDIAQGVSLGAMNDANQNTAKYQMDLNSPQGQAQAMAALQGLYSAMSPNYSGIGGLWGAQTGAAQQVATNAQNQLNTNMNGLGSLAGMFL